MRPFGLRLAAALALLLTTVTLRASIAADSIRIGYIGPLTGIFAQAGKDMLDGLKLSLEQVNIYILKVERAGGKLVNTVLHTYPLVSQFWTYSASDFLKLPAYTRDYPPARP